MAGYVYRGNPGLLALNARIMEGRSEKHGISGYTNRGCRCPICRDANRHQVRRWRKENGETAQYA